VIISQWTANRPVANLTVSRLTWQHDTQIRAQNVIRVINPFPANVENMVSS